MKTTNRSGENLFNSCRLVLMCAFIIMWTLKKVVIFEFLVDTRAITYIFAALSAMLLVWDLFTKRRLLKGKYIVIIIAFLGVCVASSVVNIKYGYIENAATIVFMAIQMLLFYSCSCSQSEQLAKKNLNVLGNLFCVLFSFFTLLMNLLYLFNVQYDVSNAETGMYINQGYSSFYGRVWGVFYFPSTVMLAIVAIGLCIYFMIQHKKVWQRIFYSLLILVNFMGITLCGARSVIYSFYILVLFVSFIFITRKSEKFTLKEVIKTGCVSAISVALAFGVVKAVQKTIPYAQDKIYSMVSVEKYLDATRKIEKVYNLNGYDVIFLNISNVINSDGETAGKLEDAEIKEVKRYDLEQKQDITNNRMAVWKDGFRMFADRPILGTSPRNMISFAEEVFPESDVAKFGRAMHNSYMDVLVETGALGVITMGLFLALIVIYMLKYLFYNRRNFKSVSCLFAILAAMFAYMLVESDVILNYTIQAMVFWFVLGTAISLIRSDNEEEMHDNKRVAFICDTPVQVFNALNFVENDIQGCSGKSDIYIYHQFGKSYEISENLKKKHIFSNVYDVIPRPVGSGRFSPCITFFRLSFPELYLKKSVSGWKRRNEYYYDKLIVCAYAPFQIVMRKKFFNAELLAMEEGLASYYGNNMEDGNSRLFRFADKYIFDGKLGAKASALYVNNIVLCNSSISENIFELPKNYSESFMEDCKFVFGYTENRIYSDKKIIILTQPHCELDNVALAYDMKLNDELAGCNISGKCVVRNHPRQKENLYSGLTLDEYRNLWELESIFQISDANILISIDSTSEIMPYMLAKKQPYLIFTYKFSRSDMDSCELENMDAFVKTVRSEYSNPDKIFLPESMEELMRYIQENNS